MSSDFYGQGQGGRDQHVRQWILTRLDDTDNQFEPSQSDMSGSPIWQEQSYLSQDSPLSYKDMSQHQDGQVQQHLQTKANQTLRQEGMPLAYSHQAAFSIPQEHQSSSSSTGLDGQSLYCTEVPSVSPPSQPITVEGGGTSRRNLVAVNGGARSHPVQYTIIITDPQLQQASGGNNISTSGATSILLNTLVQQQQQQHLQLQQQQQVQLATITEASNSLITGQTNANLLVNNNNTNGSSKFSSFLICNNNNSNLSSDGGITTSTSTFPANLIAGHQNNFSDGKGIHFTKLTLSANANLPPTLVDRGGIEGGIVILNYSEPHQRTGSATVHNINQLVNLQNKGATGSDLVNQGHAHHLLKPISEANVAVGVFSNRAVSSNSKINVCDNSELHQVDFRARVSAAGTVPYNGQGFVNKEDSGDLESSQNTIPHISQQVLPFSGELESTSSSNKVSGGMHSGRSGSGTGQAHSSHQQQQHNPISSSSSFTTSASTSSQSAMLSAGQPAVPSGIFRTGTDNSSSPQRLSASGSSSYVPPQYPPVYGIHSQTTGHLATLQPYSTFFPGFGGSGAPGHAFPHGSVMAGSSQSLYPHVESYSAMLASMGTHAQHRGAQATDRTLRVQAPVVSVTQHTGPFPSSSLQMAAPGVQHYPSITSSCHRRPSGSGSPSPGPATPAHTPPQSNTHLDPHHIEKMAGLKGSSGPQGREGETTRELRLYGDTFNLLEDKPRLSPSSTYSSSSHMPKVSFDTVVKEYGGGRDSPTGRGDLYFRASLSGKEGSLKHRILTRPSDSEALDDLSRVSGVHGLKDEPLAKRQKMANVGSATVAYGSQPVHGHHGDSQRSSSRHHAVPHTSHHSQPSSNNNTVDSRAAGVRHHPDNNLPGHDHDSQQQPSPYHHSDDSNTDTRYQPPHYQSSPASSSSSLSPTSECPPSHLQYPSHFMKGSIIQLANGTLKRVEDLQTEDFVNSAEISSDLKVDSSTVIRIEEQPDRGTAMLSFSVGEHQVQVTVEATLEHPFFVFGQGWSSCSVSRTLARYGLDCQKLNVGDVCISLTHKDVHLKAAEIGQQQQDQNYLVEQQIKLTTGMTAGSVSMEHQIPSPQSTSSSTLPFSTITPVSSSSSVSSKALLSTLKSENTDPSFLPPLSPSSSSTSAGKRRLSQTELPPPLSNIVLVKKENNGHSSRKRNSQRLEDELHEEKVFEEEEDDDADSTLSLRKRRWSAPDPGSVKAEQEREKDRQISGGKNPDESQHTSTSDNGRQ